MTCAPTDRLLQTLRVSVPGATDDMLKISIFNTMDEFLRRTSAWKYKEDVQLLADTYEYDLAAPSTAALVRVMEATHNDVPVMNSAEGVVQSSFGILVPELQFPDGDVLFSPFQTDTVPPGIFTFAIFQPNYISFTGLPGADGLQFPFKIVMALSVSKECLECEDYDEWGVPEWMWDMYFQDWLNGTMANLFALPAKPWTNTAQALFYGRRFRSNMAYRKQEIARGFAYNVNRGRFPKAGGWI